MVCAGRAVVSGLCHRSRTTVSYSHAQCPIRMICSHEDDLPECPAPPKGHCDLPRQRVFKFEIELLYAVEYFCLLLDNRELKLVASPNQIYTAYMLSAVMTELICNRVVRVCVRGRRRERNKSGALCGQACRGSAHTRHCPGLSRLTMSKV